MLVTIDGQDDDASVMMVKMVTTVALEEEVNRNFNMFDFALFLIYRKFNQDADRIVNNIYLCYLELVFLNKTFKINKT